MRDNMDPIMLPGDDSIIRGIRPWTGNEELDEELEDVVENNIHMFSRPRIMTTRGRASSRFQSHRSEKGHENAERKATQKLPRNYRQALSPIEATTVAATSLIGATALSNTPLPDDHVPKFLLQARRDYPTVRPPFVRLNRKKAVLGPKRITLATSDGQLPQREIPATLAMRAWDSKLSFYTLDINGERLIVKPVGGRFNHADRGRTQYRAWSGQGTTYESTPVAFELKDDAEDQQGNIEDSDGNVEHQAEELVVDLDAVDDEDYVPSSSEGSSTRNDSQRRSVLQGTTGKSNSREPPVTGAPLTQLNTSQDDAAARGSEVGSSTEHEPVPRASLPPLSPSSPETSTAPPKNSEVAAEKRQASETLETNRASKRGRPQQDNTILQSETIARVPQSLTEYKQERTILFVPRRGSKSDVIPIKLSSAMTIPSFFNSVCAAAGIVDGDDLGIAIMLEPWNNGLERNIILRRDTTQAFEYFLEIIDEAECWKKEGGRLQFWLQLRWLLGP